MLKPSNIIQDNAVYGMFIWRPFRTKDIVGYYYGTLLYSDLTLQKQVQKTYGEDNMSVKVETFNIWGLRLPKTFCDRAENKRGAWIVPDFFCCM